MRKKQRRNNIAPTTNHYFDLWYHQATGFYPTQEVEFPTFYHTFAPKKSPNQGSPRCFLPRHLSPCHPGSLTNNGEGFLPIGGGNFEAINLEKVDVRWVDSASQNFIPKSLSCWWFWLYTFSIWWDIPKVKFRLFKTYPKKTYPNMSNKNQTKHKLNSCFWFPY